MTIDGLAASHRRHGGDSRTQDADGDQRWTADEQPPGWPAESRRGNHQHRAAGGGREPESVRSRPQRGTSCGNFCTGVRQTKLFDLRGHHDIRHRTRKIRATRRAARSFRSKSIRIRSSIAHLRETSATYLLAVQAEPAEHDGKEHFIRVTTKQRGATVRFRQIVMIPRG